MKKTILTGLVLILMAGATFAESTFPDSLFGISFMNHIHSTTDTSGNADTWSFSGLGVSTSTSSDDPVMFYMRASIAYMLSGSFNTSEYDLSIFGLKTMAEFLLGAGFTVFQQEAMHLLMAAGPVLSFDQAIPDSLSARSISVVAVGAGLDVQYKYKLNSGIGLYASGNLAYLFTTLDERVSKYGEYKLKSFNNAVNWGLGAGVVLLGS